MNNSAVIPHPKLENDFYDWYARHETKKKLAWEKRYDVIFIGDSITHLFEGDPNVPGRGEKVWGKEFSQVQVLNLGFGWDRTQNVLWRLEHGEFTHQQPKLVVLNIGTNNLTGTPNAHENTVDEIFGAIRTICERILRASPKTTILLMGLFPRGRKNDGFRDRIEVLNRRLEGYAAQSNRIRFMDIGDKFLDPQQEIVDTLMPDLVHPSEKGYRIWAKAVKPIIDEINRPSVNQS